MIYEIEKQYEKLLKLYAESNEGIAKHRTIHGARSANLNKLVYKYLKQCHSEGIPISGPIL